jgi:hypothetical protein
MGRYREKCVSSLIVDFFVHLYLFSVRVLQYRSVAFVTYVSELHAQFAKEAMACQSLDNDEILNVRWATEDPNPVQKVAEKRRLEEMGQEAIRARMDPRIVDAMRAVRALEDGDVLEQDGEYVKWYTNDAAEDGPDPKRRRLEIESPPPSLPDDEPPEEEPKAIGLLSSDTLQSLKYFAEIRKRNGTLQVPKPAPVTKRGDLGLAGYGSDGSD